VVESAFAFFIEVMNVRSVLLALLMGSQAFGQLGQIFEVEPAEPSSLFHFTQVPKKPPGGGKSCMDELGGQAPLKDYQIRIITSLRAVLAQTPAANSEVLPLYGLNGRTTRAYYNELAAALGEGDGELSENSGGAGRGARSPLSYFIARNRERAALGLLSMEFPAPGSTSTFAFLDEILLFEAARELWLANNLRLFLGVLSTEIAQRPERSEIRSILALSTSLDRAKALGQLGFKKMLFQSVPKEALDEFSGLSVLKGASPAMLTKYQVWKMDLR
jgi:hypothetical protein